MTRFRRKSTISKNQNRQSYQKYFHKNLGNRIDFEELQQYNAIDTNALETLQAKMDEHKTKTREVVLEMLNDLPSKDVKPPDNTLFVCKLNKLTQEKYDYQRP